MLAVVPPAPSLPPHPGSCVLSGPGPRVLLRIPLRGRVCQGCVEVQVEFGRPRTALALTWRAAWMALWAEFARSPSPAA